MTFNPALSGSHESEVAIYASLMISSGHAQDIPPVASMVLRAEAEQPQLELHSDLAPGNASEVSSYALDYGVLVGGATMRRSLDLINRGHAELPLEFSITSDVSDICSVVNYDATAHNSWQ